MKCEHCKYCKGGQLPESYEEEWWCEKGFAFPMEDNGCFMIWKTITWAFKRLVYNISQLFKIISLKKKD